ncbi:MAG: class I SAM-dependent methyltransferase [Candidatus Hodarchaeota archaeon]
MNPERTPELFDQWAAGYDDFIEYYSDKFPFAGYFDVLERIVEISDPKPGMRVLDIGVGTGNLAQRFIDKDCEVWGIDYSLNMLREAEKKAPTLHLHKVDIRGDWPKELLTGFDRIVSAYVFHHFNLETKVELIQRIVRNLLKEEGCMVIGDVSYPSFNARAEARNELTAIWDDDEYYWAADEIKLILWGQGIYIVYEQISSCGGVYLFVPA